MGMWDMPARRVITDTELRFNPYHDPQNGRFTTAGGGSGGGFLYSKGGKSAYVFNKNNGEDFNDNEYEKWKSSKGEGKVINKDMLEHTKSKEFNKLLSETSAETFSSEDNLPESINMYGHEWNKFYSHSSVESNIGGKRGVFNTTEVSYQSSKPTKTGEYPIASVKVYKRLASKDTWKYSKYGTNIS